MPLYEYVCEANGRAIEVRHGMGEKLATWGELCARAGIDLDGTAADAPVARRIFGGTLMTKKRTGGGPAGGRSASACAGCSGTKGCCG